MVIFFINVGLPENFMQAAVKRDAESDFEEPFGLEESFQWRAE
jgi:hypothetical protein